MSGKSGRNKSTPRPTQQKAQFNSTIHNTIPQKLSLIDSMKDNREYESALNAKNSVIGKEIDLASEFRKSIEEITTIRKRPALCYMSNMLNSALKSSTSIDAGDEAIFFEMVNNIPDEFKEVDVILITPGGSAEIVARMVDKLRKRFDSVGFIIPSSAMSAGTIFCLSGDELIMTENACIGPIDPQVPSRQAGRFVPAQSIIALIDEIRARGEEAMAQGKQPSWTDIVLLKNIDGKEIGNAYVASKFSSGLVKEFLEKYKFKSWVTHDSDGRKVTDEEKAKRAEEIADLLCNHQYWLSHARGITRDKAMTECKLKVLCPESIEGLARAIRRFWALTCIAFESSSVSKAFISEWYAIFRTEQIVPNGGKQA